MKSAICGRILSPNHVFKPGSSLFLLSDFDFLGTSILWFLQLSDVYGFLSCQIFFFECFEFLGLKGIGVWLLLCGIFIFFFTVQKKSFFCLLNLLTSVNVLVIGSVCEAGIL